MPPSYLHSQDFEEVVPTLLFPVIVITFMCGKEVHMEQDIEKELQEIMGDATCPKDFKCYKSGFENLCKAQEVGLETFLECLEEHPMECTFSVRFGGLYYCRCPLRVYISKKFKK
jgi:hypothetical protein